MNTIYSPSQTDTHSQCPIKRALRYAGWTGKGVGKRDLAAILGTAIAAGLADYNLSRIGRWNGLVGPATAARMQALASLAVLPSQGRHIEDWDRSQANSIEGRAEKAVTRYIAADPIPPEWPILAVEELLPSGQARPDLVVDDGRGPVPIDYKTKLTLKPEYEQREMERWATSWQMHHYSWELQGTEGRLGRRGLRPDNTVGADTPAGKEAALSGVIDENADAPTSSYRFYICLIVLEPKFRTVLYPFEIHPETMRVWELSARSRWADMQAEDEGRRQPVMSTQHVDAYGPCEYMGACFGARLDPEKMRENYVQITRR